MEAPSLPAPSSAPGPLLDIRRRGVAVAIARLGVVTLLLGGTLVFSAGDIDAPSARIALGLVIAAFLGTIASALALARGVSAALVARAQIGLDLCVTTGLLYVTDGAHSGFASLYAVVVLASAIVLGARSALVTTAIALALYLGVGLALASGWIAPPPDRMATSYTLSPPDLALAVLRTSVGLLVVGALSAGLAERLVRARGEVARATERALGSERRTDDIVRSISSGLVTTDEAGRIETANPVASRILGRPEAELVGIDVATVLPLPGSRPEGATERGEADVVRPDGRTIPIGFTRTPLVDSDGTAHGALVLFTDLSELRALQKKAERAERLATLGHLAVGLAHEIRNPLGSISGSVELVRDAASLSAEDRRLLELVLSETSRLNDLVGTMLQVGRPSIPERVAVDAGHVLEDVIAALRTDEALVRARRITLTLEREGPVPALADPSQLRQLLWNLLKNAVQVSPDAGEVRARASADGESTTIEVIDRGPGIPVADRERLFEAFFSRRPQGVGLGLALARQIVEAHGGRIDVDSEVGEGTTFRVVLPRRAPSPAPPAGSDS